jgi:hypothetical protein
LKYSEFVAVPAVAPLAAILRPHLRGAIDQAALLLPDLPAIRPGAPRRMATALLEEAIRTGGGTIYRTLGGADLLCGTARPAAIRAAGALSRLLEGGLAPPIWRLPEESAELLTWAAPEYLAPAPARIADVWPDAVAFQTALDSLAAEQLLHPQTLRGADGRVAGRRLALHAGRLAAGLGAFGRDPDLRAHAEERLARRLLPGLAAWAATGQGLRLIPMPLDRLPPPARNPGAIGVVPLALVGGMQVAELREALQRLGWQLAIAGLEASSLAALQPLALPADLLVLRWSAALAAQALPAATPRERVFLAEADAAGLAWAACAGIGLIESAA